MKLDAQSEQLLKDIIENKKLKNNQDNAKVIKYLIELGYVTGMKRNCSLDICDYYYIVEATHQGEEYYQKNINNSYSNKLEKLIDQVEDLKKINENIKSNDFKVWKQDVEKLLEEVFGKESDEVLDFKNHTFETFIFVIDTIENNDIKQMKEYISQLSDVSTTLESYRRDVKYKDNEQKNRY